MKRLLLAFLLTALVGAQEPDQPPLLDLEEQTGVGRTRGLPQRGFDIRGSGDGAAHHFFYIVKSGPGPLHLQLQARAREGATSFKARLQDDQGIELSHVEALAGSQDSVSGFGSYLCDENRTIHLHVHVDPNAGPYSLTLTGPITR